VAKITLKAIVESSDPMQIQEKLAELLGDAGDGGGPITISSAQLLLLVLVRIATSETEQSSKRLEKLTARLILLTGVLVLLTIVLAFFTAPLALDALHHMKR
jgi:hypothetical protein